MRAAAGGVRLGGGSDEIVGVVAVGVIEALGMASEMGESDRVGMVDGAVVVEEVACWVGEGDGVKFNLFREP